MEECLELGNFQLIVKLRAYYLLKDLEEEQENFYVGIFDDLCCNKLSYDEIAAKYFIDVKTLFKYRNKIDLLAKKL